MKTKLFAMGAALAGLVTVNLRAADDIPMAYDFTLPAALVNVTNATITITNSGVMPIQPDKDLMIMVSAHGAAAVGTNGSSTVGIDIVGGPGAGQRTTGQPISCTVTMNGASQVVKSFYFSRTNFYGAAGLAVDTWGSSQTNNAVLDEVSGNFWR
jgi:hypothetical protein